MVKSLKSVSKKFMAAVLARIHVLNTSSGEPISLGIPSDMCPLSIG